MKKYIYLTIFIFLLKTMSVSAQNTCAGAINITPTTEAACGTNPITTFSTNSTTASNIVPGCAAGTNDWWGKFTANSNSMRIYLYGRTYDATSMQVLSGACPPLGTLTQMSCITSPNQETPIVSDIITTAGTVYYIRIARTTTSTITNISGNLCVYPKPPTNYNIACDPLVTDNSNGDDQSVPGGLANPITVTPTTEAACGTSPNYTSVTTQNDYLSSITPTCGGAQDEWWGKFTASSANTRIHLYNNADPAFMQLFSGSCAAGLAPVGTCNSGPDDTPIATDIPTTIGVTYYVRIKGSLTGRLCVYPKPSTNYSAPCDKLHTGQTASGGLANPKLITMGRENQCATNAITVTAGPYESGVTPLGCLATSEDDWWAKFTATATKTGINLYGTSVSTGVSTKPVVTQVYSAPCGSAMTLAGCMGEDTEEFADFMQLTTVVGQTYYVRISKKGSSAGVTGAKLCIWADTVTYATLPECADNTDFNNGTRSGWTCKSGYYNFTYNLPNTGCLATGGNNATLYTTPGNASGSRHILTTSNAASSSRDVNSANNITTLAPGGTGYSLRLGDARTGCWGGTSPCPSLMESIKYDISVTAANAGFTFMYAAFLENPGHPSNAQPRFEVKLTNNAGNPLPCGSFQVISGGAATGSYFQGYDDYLYSGWRTVPLDLRAYIGQTVGLEFITADCYPPSSASGGSSTTCTNNVCTTVTTGCNLSGNNPGSMERCSTICNISTNPNCVIPPATQTCEVIGTCTGNSAGTHSAYAYIDAFCVPMEIAAPTVCAGTGSVQICAPSGYISYSWPAGQPGLSGSPTTQCVTITNPVPGNSYTVNLVSPTGCPSTVSTALIDCQPAPIQLLSFSAKPASEKVNLFWTTASETDNDYFTIEKTQDSRIFLEVKRIRGAGNSTRTLQYSAIDEKPFDGLSYYRLKQTDYNGKFTYSHLVPIVMKETNKIGISYYFSSVNGSELHYLVSSAEDSESEISIEVLDMMGKRIYSQNNVSPHGIINMSSFPKAMYILKAYDKNKQALTKFIH